MLIEIAATTYRDTQKEIGINFKIRRLHGHVYFREEGESHSNIK